MSEYTTMRLSINMTRISIELMLLIIDLNCEFMRMYAAVGIIS